MPPPRVATYCRISDDREGKALGVQRQREDCEALVATRGWTLAGQFVDNDLSAYSGKPRPAYSQLLDAVRGGLLDGIVAWHPDRLHRSPRELEDFLSVVEEHGVTVETVRAGKWDLSTPSGRMTARILGSVARGESEHKSDRVRRALEQKATMGTSHGRFAYGWTRTVLPDKTKVETVNEEQAALVRDVAKRIVRGESLRSIVADLNARGVPSPTEARVLAHRAEVLAAGGGSGESSGPPRSAGKVWGKTMLRHLVTRERNVGLRIHHGEVVGAGDWPAILDRALWEQARAVLTDPARKTTTSTAAVHLLSGIARCGACDGPIRAGMSRTVPSYRCADKSCVSRNRGDVDSFVTSLVLERVGRPDLAGLLVPVDASTRRAVAEVAELRARLDLAADDYADGVLDREQFHRITERLRPRLGAAQARARVVDASPLLAGLVGADDVRKAWDGFPLSRRRAVLDLLLKVRILRSTPGTRVFDPTKVEITWKTL